jgi:NAD(P)-dependent dehydrogenase (short-subunit alcohol dehydrogenase family)
MSKYLIIGASTGIGLELARQLAAANHEVTGTYHLHPQTSAPGLSFHPLDVTAPEIDWSFLPEVVDGLVYCPGSIKLKPFHRIADAEWLQDLQLQVLGATRVLQAALPALKASGKGSVVLFSTVAVQLGMPFHALVAASKGAIEGLARSLAAEWAPVIRVNCIAPSLTDTPLAESLLNSEEKKAAAAQRHPLKRIGSVSDMAAMAEFLLSDKSSWITGQVLSVDGGMSRVKI